MNFGQASLFRFSAFGFGMIAGLIGITLPSSAIAQQDLIKRDSAFKPISESQLLTIEIQERPETRRNQDVAPADPNQDPNQDPSAQTEPKDWPFESIMKIDVTPKVEGKRKPEDSFADFIAKLEPGPERIRPDRVVNWVAADIQYRPLYFEDVVLERYGQTFGPLTQPWVSAGRFITSGLVLPYNVTREGLFSCDSPLGYGRPGTCQPFHRQRIIQK